MTRYLVTSALPYANGPNHFGHMVGAYLPADVYVRTLRMLGEEVLYVCGADEHGVAITIGAEKDGVSCPEYVARWREQMKGDMDRLGIEFDIWSGTSVSPHHAEMTTEFFERLDERGYLVRKEGEQLYCPHDEMFLADRYVEGTCPNCEHRPARGDECPNCGSWLDPLNLGEPACKLCGNAPEKRATTHWYLDMPKLRDDFIGGWIDEHPWKPNVQAFIKNLLDDVPQRAITRDLPWGIQVPVEGAEGKVIYVWFDAPIGYISFTREWADAQGDPELWKTWWKSEDTRLVHFIGKDNIPFHCMLFPAMLWGVGQDYVLPWAVPANEFYNLQGAKFNTSTGHVIDLDRYFQEYDADTTRFYLLASAPETSDSEWRWDEFQRHVGLLADKIGNLVTRVLRFSTKHFEGRIPPLNPDHAADLDRQLLRESGEISDPAESIREFKLRRACELLLQNAEAGNRFVDQTAPWGLRKTDLDLCGSVLATACEWIGWMSRWMAPFMPGKAQQLWAMLGQGGQVTDRGWPGVPSAGSWRTLEGEAVLGEVVGLFPKLDGDQIAAEIERLGTHDSAN